MEHVQEFWPQRRPMRSRPQATIARRKGIFTVLSEGTFTKLPDDNVITLYQKYIEGVLAADRTRATKEGGASPRTGPTGMDFGRLFKSVWDSFGKFQAFHSAAEVNRLLRYALRGLKRQGRVHRTQQSRYTVSNPSAAAVEPSPVDPPPGSIHRFISTTRWSPQRRHMVNSAHRWEWYNRRRTQRLSRSPSQSLVARSDAGGGGPGIRPRLEPRSDAGGGGPGIRPRLEPPPPSPRPQSAPQPRALLAPAPAQQMFGMMVRMFYS